MRNTIFSACLTACLLGPAAGLRAQTFQKPQTESAATPLTAETATPVSSEAAEALPVAAEAAPVVPERPLTVNEKRRQRGLTDTHNLFIPKGQWIFGGTASYSTHTNETYQFLIVEKINSKGYNVKVSPMIAYALRDNMAIGVRFIYGRSLARIDDANMQLGDEESGTHIVVKDFYKLTHSYTAAVIWRQYIPLGRNKRFALFNEMQLAAGGTQGRFANDSPVKGTFERGFNLSLGISPGIIAFATNNMAVEVNVGVMGITYNSVKQVHNQVTEGKRTSSMMNFKVNIFSIGLGMAFYL